MTVATRNECGENCPGSPAALSRRFIIRQMSMPLIALAVEPVRPPERRAEEGTLGDPGGLDVAAEDLLQVVPDGDLPRLAAFLGEPQGVLRPVVLEALQGELGHGADAGGRVDEDGDDGPVRRPTSVEASIDSSRSRACLAADLGRLALDDRVALGPDRWRPGSG